MTIHANTQLYTILKLWRTLQNPEKSTTGHILNAAGSGAPLEGAPDPAATGIHIRIHMYIILLLFIYIYINK